MAEYLYNAAAACLTIKGTIVCGVAGFIGYGTVKCIKNHQEEAQIRERERQRLLNRERAQENLRVLEYQHQDRMTDRKQEQAELLNQLGELDEAVKEVQARTRSDN